MSGNDEQIVRRGQQKWEYYQIELPSDSWGDITDILNQIGRDEYELVGVNTIASEGTTAFLVYTFKKPYLY